MRAGDEVCCLRTSDKYEVPGPDPIIAKLG